MLKELTAEQLDEWMAADELDQIVGQEKLYRILSLIGSAIVNSWGAHSKPGDFIPRSPADIRQQAIEKSRGESAEVTPNQAAVLFSLAAGRLGLAPDTTS